MLRTQILRFKPQVGALAILLTPPLAHLPLPTAWQTVVLVQGSVAGEEDRKPISVGTVTVIREEESKPWSSRIQDGHFAIEIPAGEDTESTSGHLGFTASGPAS